MNQEKKELLQSIADTVNQTYDYPWMGYFAKNNSPEQKKAENYKIANKSYKKLFKEEMDDESKNINAVFKNDKTNETITAKFIGINFNTNYMNYSANFEEKIDNNNSRVISFINELKPFGELYLGSSSFKDELKEKELLLTKESKSAINKILQFSKYNA